MSKALELADVLMRPGYGWHTTPTKVAAELRRQHEEIEALRKDAERYRWLTFDHPKHDTRVQLYTIAQNFNVRGKGHIDAAIDAAMGEKA